MALVPEQIVGRKLVRHFRGELERLRRAYHHGNRELFYDAVVVAYLYAFFNPTVRSQRTIEDLSRLPGIAHETGVQRICRSTFSDANRLFDPTLLDPLIEQLRRQVPDLSAQDPQLDRLLRKVIAADGSMFTIAADVAWAIHHTKSDGQKMGQIRLNLQLQVPQLIPQDASVSGKQDGSETAAVAQRLQSGAIYLTDRNFVDFSFLKQVLEVGSSFVVRAKSNAPTFQMKRKQALRAKDRQHGVISDAIGHLPGSSGAPSPPQQLLREVVILNEQTGQRIRLLTDLLELPAHLIGTLYRYRFQIELFFRWLKVSAHFEHLIAHSPNGLTLQFYVAVIAVLLMYRRSAEPLSQYAYNLLGFVASGQATVQDILPILEYRQRERQLERERLARRKVRKTSA